MRRLSVSTKYQSALQWTLVRKKHFHSINLSRYCVPLLAYLSVQTLYAEQTAMESGKDSHHDLEEVVVSAAFQRSTAETALPVGSLSGEALKEEVKDSLGETLKGMVGVQSAGFGAGVGQPVIRGQSGNRVQVLQNGATLMDASSLSPDHANSVEPILAKRIEVVRGPATLLYGNGAIGGIVNVIDDHIPESVPDSTEMLFQQSFDTVNKMHKSVFSLDRGSGSIAFHLDGVRRKSRDMGIPGFALNEQMRLQSYAPSRESRDRVENSFGESSGLSVGASFVADDGWIGLSAQRLVNQYGLPLTAPLYDSPMALNAVDILADQTFIRVDMEQDRYEAWGELERDGWILKGNLTATDYQHAELEIEGGETEIGTVFSNEGVESRLAATHPAFGGWSGVMGIQYLDREFSAIGEEAFVPLSNISSYGFYLVESRDFGEVTTEFGARLALNRVDPGTRCESEKTTFSLSASALWPLTESASIYSSVSRSERAPTVEELFSNVNVDSCGPEGNADLVPHEATGLLERGNPNLDTEVSNNIELGYRHTGDRTDVELNIFYNNVSRFILLDLTGTEIDSAEIANYIARDTRFYGAEASLTVQVLEQDGLSLESTLFADLVKARLTTGEQLPRLAPMRIGASVVLSSNEWKASLNLTRVARQNHTYPGEQATDGYTRLDMYTDYHFHFNDLSLTVFLKGNNLLDKEIRNHISFLKAYVPEAGRNWQIGLRMSL